jgi:putative ABC transport system permease protein
MQLGQALRRLARAPAFTLTTVLTLAIGIGATTAIFSVVNGVLLKPLPFPESDRLVALRHLEPGVDDDEHDASPAMYFTYRDENQTFESVALWFGTVATVTGTGDPEEIHAVHATHEFLPTLRVQPALGRAFTAAEDQPGGPSVVMLSHGYWQRRFGGAADVVGRTLIVGGTPHEVIGVLPRTFRFLEQQAEIVAPARLVRASAFAGWIGERAIARLADGATLAEASTDMARMLPIMYDSFPLLPGLSRERLESYRITPAPKLLKQRVIGDLDDVLWVLMGTIGILLLIACANVANLQLVRTEGRAQELAIRAALGAGRTVIARSLLLESVLLGLVGGAAGLAIAFVALPLAVAGAQLPSAVDIAIDSNVLIFALSVSLASGSLFGALPLLKYAGPRVGAALHGVTRAYSTSRERHGARDSLVVAQVALALVLLIASGLMTRTFQALRTVDSGIDAPAQLQTVRLSFPDAAIPEFPRVVQTQNDIADRLAAVPGVESVGFSSGLPLSQGGANAPFSFEDRPDEGSLLVQFLHASPGFLGTLGTPLVAGRDLEWNDVDAGRQVAVISEALAQRQWASAEVALGKRMRWNPRTPWIEIVGVAGDVRHNGLDRAAPLTVYLPQSDAVAPFAIRSMFFFVRSDRAGTPAFLTDLQQAIWSVKPDLPLGSVQTLGDVYQRSIARTSLTLVILAITASMAFLLGLVGIYGVVSYMVTLRTREIGVRMALGAQDAQLKRMLLRHVLLLVAVGVGLGLGVAAALTRLMQSLLFGVTALDPATFIAVAALLVATAALAGYLPARRVTRIDPMAALRQE